MMRNGGQPRGLGRPNTDPSSVENTGYGFDNNKNYLNQLVGHIQHTTRAVSGGRSESDGYTGFSYENNKTKGIFGNLFNDGTQVLDDEDYKGSIIQEASLNVITLLQRSLYNRQGGEYEAIKDALELFKRVDRDTIEPVFEEFSTEVHSNIGLYRYCLTYAGSFLVSDLVTAALSGSIETMNGKNSLFSLISGNFFNIMVLQFLTWLEHHPQGLDKYNSMSPKAKALVNSFEKNIGVLQNKLLSISVGNVTFPFPWKVGFISRMLERTQVKSTILEHHYMYGDKSPYIDNGFNSPEYSNNNNVPEDDIFKVLLKANSNNFNVAPAEKTFRDPDLVIMDNWGNRVEDVNEYPSSGVSKANRKYYRKELYFHKVPGTDDFYVAEPKDFFYFSSVMEYVGSELPYWKGGSKAENMIPVIKMNWEDGKYDYKLFPLNGVKMKTVLTDPSKVLPFINEDEDDRSLKIASFDQYMLETNKIVDENNKPVSIPECVTLDKKPDILFGNKPVNSETNEDVINTICTFSDLYDPDKSLDAFVIPFRTSKRYNLETTVSHEDVYKRLPMLVKSGYKESNFIEFVDGVKEGLETLNSKELDSIVTTHLTNTLNRWLVEKRLMGETENEPEYLKVKNIFNDYKNVLAFLKEKDIESAKELYNIEHNAFLQEYFTMFADELTNEMSIKHELSKYKDELLVIKEKAIKHTVLLEREFGLVKVNPMRPLSGFKQTLIYRSAFPALIKTIEETETLFEKHFSRKVPTMIMFDKDSSPRLWVATKVSYSDDVYSLRPVTLTTPLPLVSISK